MPDNPIQDAIDKASGDVYVPSTAEVREAYITAPDFMPYSGPAIKGAEFDAWLKQVQDEARAGELGDVQPGGFESGATESD